MSRDLIEMDLRQALDAASNEIARLQGEVYRYELILKDLPTIEKATAEIERLRAALKHRRNAIRAVLNAMFHDGIDVEAITTRGKQELRDGIDAVLALAKEEEGSWRSPRRRRGND